ncbi:hypothetical protein ACFV0T_15155 [Streptomyces sp. NPDC059582]|uniref:hypothetical protein n=1 Tax=Streptomyces sp. NPDC059582 TaxID=3346875 RepID=UPI0036B2DFE0
MRHVGLPESLGERLRAAAGLPALTIHRSGLLGLATALDRHTHAGPPPEAGAAAEALDAGPETWAQLDLFTLFGRTETYRTPIAAERGTRLRAVLGLLPSLLVFLPLAVTWYGLSRATHAYQQLRSSAEGRRIAEGRTFLDLWQDGFAGHLSGALTFGAQVWWTIASLVVLVLATLAAGLVRRAEERSAERATEEATALLHPLLTQAQLALLPLRMDTPARFAAELSRAAAQLTPLLESAHRTHAESRDLADITAKLLRAAQQDTAKLASAAAALDDAAARLRGTGDRMTATTDRTTAAAEAMSRLVKEDIEQARSRLAEAAARASGDIRRAAETSSVRVEALTDEAVRTVSALTDEAVRTLSALSDAATRQMNGLGTQVEKALDRASVQGERLVGNASAQAGASLTRLLDEVRVAAAALDRSSSRLGSAGGGLAEWLQYALGEGADRIARTYELAIATAAVELSRRFHEAGGGVETALTGLTDAVGRLDGTVHTLHETALHPPHERPADGAGPAGRPPIGAAPVDVDVNGEGHAGHPLVGAVNGTVHLTQPRPTGTPGISPEPGRRPAPRSTLPRDPRTEPQDAPRDKPRTGPRDQPQDKPQDELRTGPGDQPQDTSQDELRTGPWDQPQDKRVTGPGDQERDEPRAEPPSTAGPTHPHRPHHPQEAPHDDDRHHGRHDSHHEDRPADGHHGSRDGGPNDGPDGGR